MISSRLKDVKGTVFFLGILGSGCYPLARLLRSRGYRVCGCDSSVKNGYTDDLGIGITPAGEASAEGVSLAVYSLAIAEWDRDLLYLVASGVTAVSRAQLLCALMSEYPVRISVSGTHGKSTTTAALEHILRLSDVAHTTVSGALLSTGTTFVDGGGEIFLAEACEYKDSFLSLSPTHQIVTSVELDHTDYFASLSDVRRSFMRAARMARTVIVNIDDPTAASIAEELGREIQPLPPTRVEKTRISPQKRIITYGESENADYRITDITCEGELTRFSIHRADSTLDLTTPLIGKYNLYNLTAAAAVAELLGVESERLASALSYFCGIERRMTLIARLCGVPVFYDYAHHPTEITAAITALRERYGRVTVIFRPHTYSRTKSLWRELCRALSLAERVILLDVFAAREEAVEGVDSERLAADIPNAVYAKQSDCVRLAVGSRPDAIALMGAGDLSEARAQIIRASEKYENT